MLRPAWRVVVHISYHVNHGCHAPGITRLHCRCGGGLPGGRDALIYPSAPIEAIASIRRCGGMIENRPFMLTLRWTQRKVDFQISILRGLLLLTLPVLSPGMPPLVSRQHIHSVLSVRVAPSCGSIGHLYRWKFP